MNEQSTEPTHVVQIRVPESIWQAVTTRAGELGVSKNEVVNRMLRYASMKADAKYVVTTEVHL